MDILRKNKGCRDFLDSLTICWQMVFLYAKKGEHRNVYFRGEQEKSLQHCFLNKSRFGMQICT
ncbi:hypothetical protein D9C11_08855 [Bacillus subtilis subsp. subtilis]|nr:hypothetical protein D9C11_08855 [Bacillus subtilis subsp. subtilis]